MLSSVLRSEIAVRASVQIMRAFVEMRRFLTANAQVFELARSRRGGTPVGERAAVVARAGRLMVGTVLLPCRLRGCDGTVRDGTRRLCPRPLIDLLPSMLLCGFVSAGDGMRGIYWQHG